MAVPTRALAVVVCAGLFAGPAYADLEALARARRFYNAGDYAAAMAAARDAGRDAETADAAAIVLARAHLEQFRLAGDSGDLAAARDALRGVERARLGPRDALDHTIGLAEALYLDGDYGAAAETFEPLLAASMPLDRTTRGRVVDWWAAALDAEARARAAAERPAYYGRVVDRMEVELGREDGAAVASYWLAAAALGAGDPGRAWQAAMAGWLRLSLVAAGGDEGNGVEAVRLDLDRLVTEAIIPTRVRVESPAPTARALGEEWEAMKRRWAL